MKGIKGNDAHLELAKVCWKYFIENELTPLEVIEFVGKLITSVTIQSHAPEEFYDKLLNQMREGKALTMEIVRRYKERVAND